MVHNYTFAYDYKQLILGTRSSTAAEAHLRNQFQHCGNVGHVDCEFTTTSCNHVNNCALDE